MPSLETIHTNVEHALGKLAVSPDAVIPTVCCILLKLPAYVREGGRETALDVIKTALSFVEAHIRGKAGWFGEMMLAKSELLTAQVEYSIDVTQGKNLLNEADRTKGINAIKSTLKDAVVALRHARRVRESGFPPPPIPAMCFDAIRQKIRHQDLLFRSGSGMVTEAIAPKLIDQWERLARIYRDQFQDARNATISLANAVDTLISLGRSLPLSLELRERLKVLVTALDTNLRAVTIPDRICQRKLARILVEAFCYLNDTVSAQHWFNEGLASLEQDIQDPVSNDESGVLFQDADDWIGLGLTLDAANGTEFGPHSRKAYCVVRNSEYPGEAPVSDVVVFRAHVTRPRSLIFCHTQSNLLTFPVPSSHQVLLATESLFKAAGEDMKYFFQNKKVRPYEVDWSEALSKSAETLGLFDIRKTFAHEAPNPAILVETDGAGVHLPWTALLSESGWNAKSVLVRCIQDQNRVAGELVKKECRPLVLCCFELTESLYGYCKQLSDQIGGDFIHCKSEKDFRDHLTSQPRSLILIGCHGVQNQITQELKLTIGATNIIADHLWEPIRLPAASNVMFITCYGGGGMSLGSGQFGSQAELALDAGARLSIASRWPAWMCGNSMKVYRDLLNGIRSSDTSVWEVGARVTAFMNSLKPFGIRYWAGWSAYTSRFWF